MPYEPKNPFIVDTIFEVITPDGRALILEVGVIRRGNGVMITSAECLISGNMIPPEIAITLIPEQQILEAVC